MKGYGELMSVSRCLVDQRQGWAEGRSTGSVHPFPFYPRWRKRNNTLLLQAIDFMENVTCSWPRPAWGRGDLGLFNYRLTAKRYSEKGQLISGALRPPVCYPPSVGSVWKKRLLLPLIIQELILWVVKCKYKKLHALFLVPQYDVCHKCLAGVSFADARTWSKNSLVLWLKCVSVLYLLFLSVSPSYSAWLHHSNHDELFVLVMF